MRIVQLTDQYWPSIGGTERHVAHLSSALVDKGHDVLVVTVEREGLPVHDIDKNGVCITRISSTETRLLKRFYQDKNSSFHPPMPLPGSSLALRHVVREFQPDVVHGHNWLTYPFAAVKGDIPLVHTLHDYGGVCPKMSLVMNDQTQCDGPALMKCFTCATGQYSRPTTAAITISLRASRALHHRIDRVLAISESVAEAHLEAFRSPIEVVPTFIPDGLLELAKSTPRPDFIPDEPYILYVGALSVNKGVSIALQAYEILLEKMGEACPKMLMLGVRKPDTPDLNRPGVIVYENVPHEQVMSAWSHATIGVVPSFREGWGQVVAEALTAGCPLIMSDTVGLAPTVMREKAALTAPAGDAPAFANGLHQLLTDRALRSMLISSGQRLSKDLTLSSVTGRIEEIFVETTKKSSKGH